MTTAVYSLDKLFFLLDRRTREAYLYSRACPQRFPGLIDATFIDKAVIFATLGSIVCWWCFLVYVFFRRDYFKSPGVCRSVCKQMKHRECLPNDREEMHAGHSAQKRPLSPADRRCDGGV